MIQLYKAENTNFEFNGDYVLHPEECLLDITLNGSWDLELTYPLQDPYLELVEGAVIAAPTPMSEKQLFRIYKKVPEMTGVTVYASPIFLDAAHDVFLLNVRPTNKTGQEALDLLTAGSRYSGQSNISRASTAYYERKNLIEALASDDENSFLNRWGGEIYYDNFKIYINEKVGGDYGVTAQFGRNLKSIKEVVDMSEVITRIVPVAYNGYMLAGNTPWVDSENISKYPIVYTKAVTYEDIKLSEDAGEDETGYDSLEELRAALKKRAEADFKDGCDLPDISYQVKMIDLAQTEEYADVKILETIGLGDTVYCRNKRLNIETQGRCTRIVYDCIRRRNDEIEIGDYQNKYFSRIDDVLGTVSGVINTESKTVMADRVAGILNAMNVSLRAQSSVAKKVGERALYFEDLDESSPTYGAMIIGTKGWMISRTRTADGRDWDWKTAATAEGIRADAVITGLLTDKTGKNYWDLDNGEFYAGNGEFSGKVTAKEGHIGGNLITEENMEIIGNGLIVGMDANIMKRTAQDEVYRLIGSFTGNNPNIMINAPGNVLYLGYENTTKVESVADFYATWASLEWMQADSGKVGDMALSSSERYKEAIAEYDGNALDIVKRSQIYTYHLKKDKKKHQKYGFIVERGCPEEVITAEGDGIDIYSAVAILWKAVQQLLKERDENDWK